jgi:non-heme chloroperoxidase
MPYASASDGTRIYYKDWGSGPPVVLIHGWPLSSDSFDDVALALAERGFRAIAHDRRGFGRSDQPWDGYDYDTFTSDVETVLDAAGATGPLAMAGFSMGGGEVARFVAKNPGRVTHAVLIGSVVPFLLKTDDHAEGVPKQVFDGMIDAIRADRAEFFQSFFKDFFGVSFLARPVSDAALDNAWRQAMMAGLRPTLACIRAFSETDFRKDLQSFPKKTLIIHGRDDQTVPIDLTAKAVNKALPPATFHEYDHAAHGLFESHKDRLISDLLEFLG